MNAARLTIDIRSWWHPGSGRGGGAVVDATAHRDADGLPVLPGRHIKGLLRDALECAETWGWAGHEGLAQRLFGTRTEDAGGQPPQPGCLRVSDARLPQDIAAYLSGHEIGRGLIPGLFHSRFATAIDHDTGTALDHSLRGIEVVVPLQLEAQVQPVPGRAPQEGWDARLAEVLPLIRAVGAGRHRGLGRAELALEVAA
ncbi:RAMP superfamily CRISPR-associated protein [Thioalkalivibrio sp. AKL10]|uniref:RAMP superfamily CRISPR-associated protein n=1 Tax=Thioalkalivibrio sp. AKL10 TaxID=1158158 RepID=UPI0003829CE1|nr:RAMP superfamily CRISPR-associated protein [Thioalkalivibrio sp. AKL10]